MSSIDAELRSAFTAADHVAALHCRKHQIPCFDHEDVRQDLILDLLRRARNYDPRRSSFATFATVCFRHRTARLKVLARRDRIQRHAQSLDELLPGSSDQSFADTLANKDGLGAWLGQDVSPAEQAEERLDLDRALSAMSPDVVPLCVSLLMSDRTRTGSGQSRTTLHRRVQDLRCRLLAAGVGTERGTHRRGRG